MDEYICAHVVNVSTYQVLCTCSCATRDSIFIPGVLVSISMEFVVGLSKDLDGNSGVVVFVYRLSKMAHLANAKID